MAQHSTLLLTRVATSHYTLHPSSLVKDRKNEHTAGEYCTLK